jgi:hypothetical protein
LVVAWKLLKELGSKVDSSDSKIGFESNELDLDSGPRVGGKGVKEISMSQLDVGFNSQQQVSIIAPTSSDQVLAAALAFYAKLLTDRRRRNISTGTNDRRTS